MKVLGIIGSPKRIGNVDLLVSQVLKGAESRVTSTPEPRTWIGYPRAIPDCPPEAQETLWEETFDYIKKRDLATAAEHEIVMFCVQDPLGKHNTFAKSKGFEEEDQAYRFTIDVQNASTADCPSYTTRIASEHDLDLLVELSKVNSELRDAFPNEDALIAYFKDRVLPEGHTVLLFDHEDLIAAGAPLHGYAKEGVVVQFSAIHLGFQSALKALLVEISKHCVEQGWGRIPLLFSVGYGASGDRSALAKELGGTPQVINILFGMKIKQS